MKKKTGMLPILAALKRRMGFGKSSIKLGSTSLLPTEQGHFIVQAFEDIEKGIHHVALMKGDLVSPQGTLVRIHSECLTGDVLGSKRCDCGEQLKKSLGMIEKEGSGLFIYLKGHEGRGIGLSAKIQAYALQDLGMDTVEANTRLGFDPDMRIYKSAIDLLHELKILKVRLITNNPAKVKALEDNGIEVVERIPLTIPSTASNKSYLKTKHDKLGHFIEQCV